MNVYQQYIPPIFSQADQRLEGGKIRASRALESALAQRMYSTRTIPDIINGQAARGSFWSGATMRKRNRAAEDFGAYEAGRDIETAGSLADILRNQYLIGLGVRL